VLRVVIHRVGSLDEARPVGLLLAGVQVTVKTRKIRTRNFQAYQQADQTLLPKTGKFTGKLALIPEVAPPFRQLLPRCDEGPPCLGCNRTGKNRELSRIFDPAGISPNEVSEAAEFWTRLNGASIVFSIGCALENQGLS